jgi:hypothetical protein
MIPQRETGESTYEQVSSTYGSYQGAQQNVPNSIRFPTSNNWEKSQGEKCIRQGVTTRIRSVSYGSR